MSSNDFTKSIEWRTNIDFTNAWLEMHKVQALVNFEKR